MIVRVFWGVFILIVAVSLGIASFVQPNFSAPPHVHIAKASLWDTPAARNATAQIHKFTMQTKRDEDYAILVPSTFGPLRFELNGRPLKLEAPRPHESVARYHTMAVARFDRNLLVDGENTLSIQRDGIMKGLGLPDIFIGPWTTISARADHQRFIVTCVDRMTLTMMSVCALLSLVMMFVSRRPVHYAYLFAVFALLAGNEIFAQIPHLKPVLLEMVTYVGLTFLMLSGLAIGIWTNRPASERQRLFWLWLAAMVVSAALDLSIGVNAAQTVPARIGLFAALGIYVMVWVIFSCLKFLPTMSVFGAVTFSGNLVIATSYAAANLTVWSAIDAEQRLFLLTTTNLVQFFGFASMIGSAALLELGDYRQAVRRLGTLERIASRHVLDNDAQANALREQIEQVAVLQERERFTRDMHDGIGGHLLSILLKARRGDLTSEVAEHEVGKAIDDLRLITAALDLGQDSLLAALETFKDRAEYQLSLADMTLDWDADRDLAELRLDPRVVLEILRWIQEALANAIRHSGGQCVLFRASIDHQTQKIVFKVEDDGIGIADPKAIRSGRGLSNMMTRAQRLQGSQACGQPISGPGLWVSLTLDRKSLLKLSAERAATS